MFVTKTNKIFNILLNKYFENTNTIIILDNIYILEKEINNNFVNNNYFLIIIINLFIR